MRATVRDRGASLKDLTAKRMVAALVAAALVPIARLPEPVAALVGLLAGAGGGYVSDFLRGVVDRLRGQGSSPSTDAALQTALERELLAALQRQDERAAGLWQDAGALLRSVHGARTALEAATPEVQVALAAAFTELGGSFSAFGWMLDEVGHTVHAIEREQARQGAEQRHQGEQLHGIRVQQHVILRRLEARGARRSRRLPRPLGEQAPYKGLATFEAEDERWFFGRERLVAELVVRLSETPFLAVVGPSGSGKSSVLRAGLLPAVRDGAQPGVSVWAAIVLTPGPHPLEELAAQLGVACQVAAGQLLNG